MSTTLARERYPSDLTDVQWDNIEHLFPQGDGRTGRPRSYPLREIVNAILYLDLAPFNESGRNVRIAATPGGDAPWRRDRDTRPSRSSASSARPRSSWPKGRPSPR